MAHEVERALFVSEPAWHGLGTVLPEAPSVEAAIGLAGLDWSVSLADLVLAEDGRPVTHKAVIRASDSKVLGVVGPGFVPLQNQAAFAWFEPFIAAGEAKIEAAGSLRGGKRVWILAKVARATDEVVSGDEISQYILLAHGHDGTLAIRVGFSAIRVVCANTLTAAISDEKASRLLRIRHSSRAIVALEEVREIMDTARGAFRATTEQLRFLAKAGCDEGTLKRYVRTVFSGPKAADDEDASPRIVSQVTPLFSAGKGAEYSRGTLYGAFNAVSEYLSHYRGKSADARVDSQWFGDSAVLIDRARSTALEFAEAAR